MKPLLLLVIASHCLPAETLSFTRHGTLVVLNEVYLNHHGPFRMMVDTGAAASSMRPEVARRIGAIPAYTVEQVTVAAARRTPALLLDEVRTGSVSQPAVEFLIAGGLPSGIDGVLGQSWLVRHDYLIDYRRHRLVLDGEAPAAGDRTALRMVHGRPAIAARVDGRTAELVLDSGADTLVLFGRPRFFSTTLFTSQGAVLAGTSPAHVALARGRTDIVPAAWINGTESGGLFPLHTYSAVYVSNREGFVVFVP